MDDNKKVDETVFETSADATTQECQEEGLSLDDIITAVGENSNSEVTINKEVVAEWMKENYDGIIKINRRENYTSTGLPLADTHYIDIEKRKKCFIYVYEVENGCFFLVRSRKKEVNEVKENHPINASSFPKPRDNGKWYSMVIDNSYKSNADVFDALDIIISQYYQKPVKENVVANVADVKVAEKEETKAEVVVAEKQEVKPVETKVEEKMEVKQENKCCENRCCENKKNCCKKCNAMRLVAVVVIIAILAAILIVGIIATTKMGSNSNNSEYETKINTLQTTIVEKEREISEKTTVIESKQNEITEMTEEINALKSAFFVLYMVDDEIVYTESVVEDEDVKNVPAVPAKAGFNGAWSSDGKNISDNTIIKAVYTSITSYSISYILARPTGGWNVGCYAIEDDNTVEIEYYYTVELDLENNIATYDGNDYVITDDKFVIDLGDGEETFTINREYRFVLAELANTNDEVKTEKFDELPTSCYSGECFTLDMIPWEYVKVMNRVGEEIDGGEQYSRGACGYMIFGDFTVVQTVTQETSGSLYFEESLGANTNEALYYENHSVLEIYPESDLMIVIMYEGEPM